MRITIGTILFLLCTVAKAQYSDGTYCAETSRYNPRTQKQSTYTQTVELEDEKVVQLNWPSGGYSDADDFEAKPIIGGKASLKDFSGILYTVKIIKKGTDCFAGIELVQCSGETKSGSRCKNKTGDRSGRCHLHR